MTNTKEATTRPDSAYFAEKMRVSLELAQLALGRSDVDSASYYIATFKTYEILKDTLEGN